MKEKDPSGGELGRSGRGVMAARVAAMAVAVVGMVRLSWISDDSLITLRTALNWANGWGPVYNAAESVQAYTHPSWFVLWTVLGSTTGEWILTIAAASVAFAAAAFLLALAHGRTVDQVIGIAAALMISNAFMEYSTSGLENPLACLVVGILIMFTATRLADRSSAPRAISVGLLVALLALTRLDLLLLAGPAGALFAWAHRGRIRSLVLAGASLAVPITVWFAWAYYEYAALLPNTFAAKRNIDIPTSEALIQGFRYLRISAQGDPGSALVGVGALALVVTWGTVRQRAWALGSVLYLAYVVWISGDFMVGRFVAVPLYALVVAAAASWSENRSGRLVRDPAARSAMRRRVLGIVGGVGLVAALSVAGRAPVAISPYQGERWDFGTHAGVADERGIQFDRGRGVLQTMRSGTPAPEPFVFPSAESVDLGPSLTDVRAAARGWPKRPEGSTHTVEVEVRCGNLGIAGILSGPNVHWIDPCGLTDRFLAERVYVARNFQWRVGHYRRSVPEGYEEAVRLGDPSEVHDPSEAARLAELWSRIRR
jgi:arabinofuranosyltransferase